MLSSFIFEHNQESKDLDLILPGGSAGIESQFIQKLIEKSRSESRSFIAINYPYYDRGESNSSGKGLIEEISNLDKAFGLIRSAGEFNIRVLAKSLGAVVLSKAFKQNTYAEISEIVVLGYVLGESDLSNFAGKLKVIQGERDKYGSIKDLELELKNRPSASTKLITILGADHSYRDPNTKEPIYEDKAIKEI